MAVPTKRAVHLFYDILSPYSYFAFETLCKYKERWNMDLKLQPTFMGGIFKQVGNRSILATNQKARYTLLDILRLSEYYGVPVNIPKEVQDRILKVDPKEIISNTKNESNQEGYFPGSLWESAWFGYPAGDIFIKNSLPTMRFVTASKMNHPTLIEALTRELYQRLWARHQDVRQPDSLAEAAMAVGISTDQSSRLIEKMSSQEVKDELRRTTQQCLVQGGFGVPVMVTKDIQGETQMFFGSDRLHLLAKAIDKKYDGPLV